MFDLGFSLNCIYLFITFFSISIDYYVSDHCTVAHLVSVAGFTSLTFLLCVCLVKGLLKSLRKLHCLLRHRKKCPVSEEAARQD